MEKSKKYCVKCDTAWKACVFWPVLEPNLVTILLRRQKILLWGVRNGILDGNFSIFTNGFWVFMCLNLVTILLRRTKNLVVEGKKWDLFAIFSTFDNVFWVLIEKILLQSCYGGQKILLRRVKKVFFGQKMPQILLEGVKKWGIPGKGVPKSVLGGSNRKKCHKFWEGAEKLFFYVFSIAKSEICLNYSKFGFFS